MEDTAVVSRPALHPRTIRGLRGDQPKCRVTGESPKRGENILSMAPLELLPLGFTGDEERARVHFRPLTHAYFNQPMHLALPARSSQQL